jgi:putative flippase GtrA
MKNELLILSAAAQLGVATVLGWLLGMYHAFNTNKVLIFKSQHK